MRVTIGNYYRSSTARLYLAAASTQYSYNALMCPLDRRDGLQPLNSQPAPWRYNDLMPAEYPPAEVIDGILSSRHYVMRALRHPTTHEVIVTAGCRFARGFFKFAQMLDDTECTSGRTRELQRELITNLAHLRGAADARGWKV